MAMIRSFEGGGFVAVNLGDAAQALGPADGMFDLYAASGMGVVIGALGTRQGGERMLFAAPGLAVGQAFGGQVVVGHQAQVAQISQHLP